MSAEPLNPINSPTPILPPQPFATPVTVGIQPQPFVAPVQIGLVSNQTAPIQIFGEVPMSSLWNLRCLSFMQVYSAYQRY